MVPKLFTLFSLRSRLARRLRLLAALAGGLGSSLAFGQSQAPMPQQPQGSCVVPGTSEAPLVTGASSVNGWRLSPHGNMKMLVIFAGFTEEDEPTCSSARAAEWPNTADGTTTGPYYRYSLPPNLGSYFYTSQSQFSPTATDQTFSNLLYQMSRTSANPFRVTFGWLPARINVPYNAGGNSNLLTATQAVLQKAVTDYPNFDWAAYDQRTNYPNFAFDNSTTGPDGQLDYVVVIWRAFGQCTVGIGAGHGAAGSALGAVTVPPSGTRTQTLTITDGHLQTTNVSPSLFMHELAHNLYNPPHLLTADNTTGNRLHATNGWGMMAGIQTYFSANAWERWHLGWMDLQASNGTYYTVTSDNGTQTSYATRISSDIQNASSLAATNGYYVLRDFVSTGDVVRIRLPNTTNQYLWLENRLKDGPFNRRHDGVYQKGDDGVPFPQPSTGLVAMVESLGDRTPIAGIANNDATRINQLRTLSAEGNFDYAASSTASSYNGHMYGQQLYNFSKVAPNASGGASQITKMRLDKNNDNIIKYHPGSGNDWGVLVDNEWGDQSVLSGTFNDGCFGPQIGSRTVGFRYGLDSNPLLMPNQFVTTTTTGTITNVTGLSEIALSGLSVEITSYNSTTGDITIRVRFDNTSINRDTRWTGELRTYPVSNATSPAYAITVNSGYRLTLDRSGTAQRSTLSSRGDFVNDTKLTLTPNARLTLNSCASLDLKGAGTTLYVENGSGVYVSGCAQITAYTGTTISVNNLSDINVMPALKVGSTMYVRSTGQTINGTL